MSGVEVWPQVRLRGISKSYPGVRALDQVDIDVGRHEVVGLIGENGAGKSTLLKVLAGLTSPDAGSIELRGEKVSFRSVIDANSHGVGMVFQEQSLLPNVSIAENVFLGHERPFIRGGLLNRRAMSAAAAKQLARVHLDVNPLLPVERLSFAQRQMVEIAKVLAIQERVAVEPVILLDEPTSVLEGEETEILFERVRELRQSASIVFISHRLDEVVRISDRVYVMRDGARVAERSAAECDIDELHQLMVGREHASDFYATELQVVPDRDRVVLAVDGLGGTGFRDISFQLHPGEMLGIAGVEGSGRENLCRAIFGAEPWTVGTVTLNGTGLRPRGPADAVEAGIAYVPAERRAEGAAQTMSVRENMTFPSLRQFLRHGFLSRRAETSAVDEWISRLRIRVSGPEVGMGTLSGGNQQKVVLAKWLITQGIAVMILDRPGRGLDVGAKSEVYRFVREMAAEGLAVLLIADTLDEAIALSSRILVMRDGEVTAEFDSPPGAKPAAEEVVQEMV